MDSGRSFHSPRNDEAQDINPYSRGVNGARVMCGSLEEEGAGNAGCAARTHSLAWKNINHTSIVTTGTPLSTGIPRAIGFNGFLRALPGEPGFLATIPGAMRKHRRQVDTSVGVSGPHDFSVRLKRRSSTRAEPSIASRAQRP